VGYEKKKKRKTADKCCMPSSDWEIEEDLRAVTRAEAVKADPERMKKVKALAKEKLGEYQRKKEEAQEGINLAAE
jgi:maleate cis-trans isomerase